MCPKYFMKLVNLYKGAVVYLLRGRKTFLIPVLFNNYITAALKLLEKLYKVSVEGSLWEEGSNVLLRHSVGSIFQSSRF